MSFQRRLANSTALAGLALIAVLNRAETAPASDYAPRPATSESTPAPQPQSRPSPDIRVWVPVDPASYSTSATTTKARSSASYRVESNRCPPGTWRWESNSATTEAAFDVASALIVRLEPVDGVSGEAEAAFAAAAENVAHAFRVETGVEVDEAGEIALRFARHHDAIGRLQQDWESGFPTRVQEAAQAIGAALAQVAPMKVRITAIVAREHIVAQCAPIEVCEAGTWTRDGQRAKSTRRTTLPPSFFGPRAIEITGAADVDAKARATAQQIGEWLRGQYTREAAAAALLADGGDPSTFAAPAAVAKSTR